MGRLDEWAALITSGDGALPRVALFFLLSLGRVCQTPLGVPTLFEVMPPVEHPRGEPLEAAEEPR